MSWLRLKIPSHFKVDDNTRIKKKDVMAFNKKIKKKIEWPLNSYSYCC